MKSLIIEGIRKYVKDTNANGFVLGISGGKDSTVVAKLLVEALGSDKVLGVMMPNGIQPDLNDSIKVCELLGIDFTTISIKNPYESLIGKIEEVSESTEDPNLGKYYAGVYQRVTNNGKELKVTDKAKTNIAPRIRMSILYAIAQSIGYRVAGTGNRSERYIGWCTKWGDMAADYNPIAPYTCSEVMKIGDELGLPYELVHKTPSDGLTGKSDEDNFGFTYDQLDRYLLNGTSGNENVDKKIREMHKMSDHKTAGVYTSSISYSPRFIPEDLVTDSLLAEMSTIFVSNLID